MGKGSGNLIAEQWLAFLSRPSRHITKNADYDLGRILSLAQRMGHDIPDAEPSHPLPELLLGHFDLSVDERAGLSFERLDHAFSAARARTTAGAA